jgi:hypothetical protein
MSEKGAGGKRSSRDWREQVFLEIGREIKKKRE